MTTSGCLPAWLIFISVPADRRRLHPLSQRSWGIVHISSVLIVYTLQSNFKDVRNCNAKDSNGNTQFLRQWKQCSAWCQTLTINNGTILYFSLLSLFPVTSRFWVAAVLFHSYSCPSLEATGLRGPIMNLKTHQRQINLPVLPPTLNWKQTVLQRSTGSSSWAR